MCLHTKHSVIRACVGLGMLACAAWPAVAQEPSVAPAPPNSDRPLQRLGVEHGLSHNSVLSVAQDQSGFLWFGTSDGLNRYDGRSFIVHRADPTDDNSLPSSAIYTLLVDRDDNIWIGTPQGLARFGKDRRSFERWPLVGSAQRNGLGAGPAREPSVGDLLEAENGDVWIATSAGLYRIAPRAGGKISRDDARLTRILDAPAYGVGIDPTGTPWTISYDLNNSSRLRRAGDGGTSLVVPLTSRAILFAADGDIWLDAKGPVPLASLLSEGGALLGRRPPTPVIDAVTSDFAVDHDGRVWIGTYRGIYVQDRDRAIRRVPTDGFGNLADEVSALLVDRGGTVWIGTFNGVLRHDPRRKPFRHFGLDAGLPSEAVSSIVEMPDAEIWVGTYGDGVARFDEQAGRFIAVAVRPPGAAGACDYVWDLQPGEDGTLWIGTEDALCELRQTGTARRVALPPGTGQPANLAHKGTDALWVGSLSGLFAFDSTTSSYRELPYSSNGSPHPVDALNVTPAGVVWAASAGGGTLTRYDLAADALEVYPDLIAEGIWDIYSDGTRSVWLATGAGLARFQSGPEQFSGPAQFGMVASAGDLIRGVVFSLLPDDEGRLWIGTNNGLIRYDANAGMGGAGRRFGVRDGVENREFNRHAALRDSRGRMWFGGMSGVTMFDPGKVTDNSLPPPMVITAVTALDSSGEHLLAPASRLVLAPDNHAVTLEFAALDFTDSSRNRYQYQLEGVDPGWLDNDTRRSVRYTDLPPGSFLFRVRGTNNDGVWSDIEATQLLIVEPAFWQTLWFRVTSVLAVLTLLWAVYSWRIRRVQELARMRLRIASDLHDDIASELSAISLLSGMLRKRPDLPAADRDSLEEIGGTSRRVIEALRDIVWYVTPEHDNIGSMVTRMRTTAERLLMNIEHTIRVDVEGSESMIDMNQRREIVLAYKELVHNIVRHAEASEVEIAIDARSDLFRMSIRDDGVGFADDSDSDGTGLRSVRRRVARIGGEIRISSEPGRGTSIEMSVPLARIRHRKAESADIR